MCQPGPVPYVLAAVLALGLPVFAQPTTGSNLERARQYLEAREFASALAAALEVVKTEPENAPAHLIAGAAALRIGRLDEAERSLQRAADLDAKLGLVRYQLGLLAVERAKAEKRSGRRERRYADAAKWFDRELSVSPGLCKALEARTKSLIAADRSDAASESVEEWVAGCPTAVEAWHLLAQDLLGNGDEGRLASLPDRVPAELPHLRTDMLWFVAAGTLLSEDRSGAISVLEVIANEETREPERVAAAAAAWALRGSYDTVTRALDRLIHARHLESYSTDEPLLVLGLSVLDAPEGTLPEFSLPASGKTLVPHFEDPSLDGDLTLPMLLHKEAPEYPEALREVGATGTVVLVGIVSRAGRFVPMRVERASHAEFVESAIRCVVRWRYAPAARHGLPLDMMYVIRSDFRLGGS